MADSTTHLDLIRGGQRQKEVTANALFDAMSGPTLFGRRAARCTGLVWAYYGGRYRDAIVLPAVRLLAANTTTYMVATRVDGVVSFFTGTSEWNNGDQYMRLYRIVTGATGVTSYEDHRNTYPKT